MNPQDFFQNIVIQQQAQEPDPQYLQWNYVVQEISNNWPFVRWMMDKYRHGKLSHMDQMEQLWYNFLTQNNIDVEFYKNNNENFLMAWSKAAPPIEETPVPSSN